MTLLLTELMEKLKEESELFILETLQIDSEMLVDRFSDCVEEKAEILEELLGEDSDEEY